LEINIFLYTSGDTEQRFQISGSTDSYSSAAHIETFLHCRLRNNSFLELRQSKHLCSQAWRATFLVDVLVVWCRQDRVWQTACVKHTQESSRHHCVTCSDFNSWTTPQYCDHDCLEQYISPMPKCVFSTNSKQRFLSNLSLKATFLPYSSPLINQSLLRAMH